MCRVVALYLGVLCVVSGCAIRERAPEPLHAVSAWVFANSRRTYFPPTIASPSEDQTQHYEVALRARVDEYLANHPNLPEHRRSLLKALHVSEALTKDEVRLLLGAPRQIRLNPHRYGATELWIYRFLYGNEECTYQLFFQNGALIRMDDVYVTFL